MDRDSGIAASGPAVYFDYVAEIQPDRGGPACRAQVKESAGPNVPTV